MALPSWAPDLDEVADYVTSRTVDMDAPGSDSPIGTFTSDTYPNNEQVDRLIASACSWVVNVTGLVGTALEGSAKDVAAMRAAALVELSYPIRDNDIDVATTMLAQAKFARDELVAANLSQGAAGVNVGGTVQYGFPDASAWRGDNPVRTWL